MGAGRLRERVRIELPAADETSLAGSSGLPNVIGTFPCNVLPLFGRELKNGEGQIASFRYSLILRFSDSLNSLSPTARITWGAKSLELVALPENIEGRRQWIRLLVEERQS
jgi:hypothetical protein